MFRILYFSALAALIFASAVTARDIPSRSERLAPSPSTILGSAIYR